MKLKIEVDGAEIGQYVIVTVAEGVIVIDGDGMEEEPEEEETPVLTAVTKH